MPQITGKLIDLHQRSIYGAKVIFNHNGIIESILPEENPAGQYILPGYIDAHIHIESSMLVPYEFAKIALRHGTVATISDPHEIANVLGVEGVKYMIQNAADAKLKFHFGAPSCVPATKFETAGAEINAEAVKQLLEDPDIYYLSEMMNYPGVLYSDPEVMLKIAHAKSLNKNIDGHAPGLRGSDAQRYIQSGITTDHECFSYEEALDKISYGIKIIIREGSAARNFDALHPLIKIHPDKLMFCSDDKHPDELLHGHINLIVKRALQLGYDLFDVLRIACVNPVLHYGMRSGLLRPGDPADFILINNLTDFNVLATFIDGEKVSEEGKVFLPHKTHTTPNQFNTQPVTVRDLSVYGDGYNLPVIVPVDGSLITEKFYTDLPTAEGQILTAPDQDILKITVINRYYPAPPSVGFIKGFGLKDCAIASTVAHDSHNIIATGSSDELIVKAINALIISKGGLSLATEDTAMVLPLPVAGLMSDLDAETVGMKYAEIDSKAREMGAAMKAPFMTLSFMALLVIPKIKISDLGIFDAESFSFYDKYHKAADFSK
jgi:adenine deaminase